MKIPGNNFGYRVAEPQRQAIAPQDSQVANATQRLGQTMVHVGDQLQQVQQQKQRAQAVSSLANLTNDIHDLSDEIGRDVTAGKIKPEEAESTYQKRLAEQKKLRTEGLGSDQLALIDERLISVGGAAQRKIKDVVIKRNESDTDANILQTGEALQRAAMRDLPGSLKSWEAIVDAVPHWDQTKKQQAKQTFRETSTFNFANATLEGAAQTGNLDLVIAARGKIEGQEGEAIDPARRTALITKAYAYENGIKASGIREQEKLAREAEARENKGRDAYKDALDLTLNGRYLSTEYIAELATVTAGTSAAPAVQELVKMQGQAAGFASLPLSQQKAVLEQRNAAGSTPGVGTDPNSQKITDYMTRIHEGSAKAYAENPWTAAQERGVIKNAPEFNAGNIDQAQAVLAERLKTIEVVEAAAGRKVSPLQPQEADQIGRLVRALPPDQQANALATFGTMIPDPDRLTALAKQIDSKDKVLGTAMMFANMKTTFGRHVSEVILRGDRALKDKSIMVDQARETGWRGQIANEIGDAFPNQEVRDKMIDAAFYIQAGFMADGQGLDLKRAIRLAAGEIVERNGSKIPLPYGWDESRFDKSLSAITPDTLSSQAPDGKVFVGKTGIPVSEFVKSLPDAALVHAGQGRYNVRAGMGLVTNSQGQRITLQVTNAR